MCELTPDRCVTFSDSGLAPSEARSFVRLRGCPEHETVAMDALLLIASELVTNAVRYGQPPIVLRLSCQTSEVRLSVSDTGPWLPRGHGTLGSLGLGLAIVADTTRVWGTTPRAAGKEVWCRVPTGMLPVERAPKLPTMTLDQT